MPHPPSQLVGELSPEQVRKMQSLPQWQEKVDKTAAALGSAIDEVKGLIYQHDDERERLHAIISFCDALDALDDE